MENRSELFRQLNEVKKAIEGRSVKKFAYYVDENKGLTLKLTIEATAEERPEKDLAVSYNGNIEFVKPLRNV